MIVEGAGNGRGTYRTVTSGDIGVAVFAGFGFAVEDAGTPECETACFVFVNIFLVTLL